MRFTSLGSNLVRMGEIVAFKADRLVLCPEDLRIAAEAFDAALQSLPERAYAMKPYLARNLLARYIIEKALIGEHDSARLRDGALAYLANEAARQTA
jgi:hypothetical protein